MHDGSSPTTGHAGGEPRLDRAQAAAQHAAGGVDLAGGGPGQRAADGAGRQLDGVPEGLEHGDGVGGDGGVEVVGEGVGPEQEAGAAVPGGHGARRATGRPGERAPGDRGDRALRGDPAQPLRHRPQRAPGRGVQRVHHPRREPAHQVQPAGQRTHRVVRHRAHPPAVALREELGLVGGHVDPDRAVALAPLARQAQVQRLGHLVGLPAVLDHLAVRHLEQQPGASPRGVHLLARGPEARAHHPAVRGDALAHAQAAAGGAGEAAAVVRERERGGVAQGGKPDEDPQVVVQPGRPHDAIRVEPAVGVPDPLELLEGPDDRWRIHAGEQFGPGRAVAVLAGQRPAVRDGEVGRVLQERSEVRDPGAGCEVEVDPDVQAAVAEVPVVDAAATVAGEHAVELAQVGAEPLRRHRGVLPARPRLAAVRGAGQDPGAVLPDPPQRLHPRRFAHHQRRERVGLHGRRDGVRGRVRLGARRAAGLDVEPAPTLGQLARRGLHRIARAQRRDQAGVHPLDGQRVQARGRPSRGPPRCRRPGSRARPARGRAATRQAGPSPR